MVDRRPAYRYKGGGAVGKAFGIPFRIPFGRYFFSFGRISFRIPFGGVFSNGTVWMYGAQRIDIKGGGAVGKAFGSPSFLPSCGQRPSPKAFGSPSAGSFSARGSHCTGGCSHAVTPNRGMGCPGPKSGMNGSPGSAFRLLLADRKWNPHFQVSLIMFVKTEVFWIHSE